MRGGWTLGTPLQILSLELCWDLHFLEAGNISEGARAQPPALRGSRYLIALVFPKSSFLL